MAPLRASKCAMAPLLPRMNTCLPSLLTSSSACFRAHGLPCLSSARRMSSRESQLLTFTCGSIASSMVLTTCASRARPSFRSMLTCRLLARNTMMISNPCWSSFLRHARSSRVATSIGWARVTRRSSTQPWASSRAYSRQRSPMILVGPPPANRVLLARLDSESMLWSRHRALFTPLFRAAISTGLPRRRQSKDSLLLETGRHKSFSALWRGPSLRASSPLR
mmetsp:Transcript_15872/g.48174  ORF Transcript_15872/g.48174 Transcript_15872/m.48174 type:complete len:222 (+) Transcript_15872:968-1633(+)